ncbi:MAG: aldehyde dehydrogenase family protein, partial [Ilumatobacter sp.]|nr:aldehyde dehydrogenase family protein [Ilumatobacter sp.]
MTSLPQHDALATRTGHLLAACGAKPTDGDQMARTPITGGSLGAAGSAGDIDTAVDRAHEAFEIWRTTPAPVRGNVVRRLGELLREHKSQLGELVSIEAGKIRSEGLGEVQEMIDICDFAVGLSRQLYGKTMHSERALHRMYEQWHPLGPVGI